MSARQVEWFGTPVRRGEKASLSISVSEDYSGADVTLPVQVWRGQEDGPTVCVTAAVHGDEINGTGAIRHIIRETPFSIRSGTLVLVPVVNILGFQRHARYLPDRKDLNRSFPGSATGSLASRIAWSFFRQVTKRCQYGIDLHTAAIRRTNFPNVRADMNDDVLASFARAFGAELIVSNRGPQGSLRSAACKSGCRTLILEAGEVWKVEPSVVEYAVRGISNCLRHLGMVEGVPEEPPYRVETDANKWIRATHGGFLEYHVSPGDIVDKGDAIATNMDLIGEESNIIRAPRDGIVLGLTTIPSVGPGDPVCHLAFPRANVLRRIERVVDQLDDASLHERVRDDLSRSVRVTDPDS
ncbi:MAG: succinylglutamate desuccinylase/aspartoacylase family protein [Phycisphaerales bacterium]|nr:succinylglutamate desuccinylase/aspartoacylase family protein [Phycisphaerales bacterium]